MRRESIGLMDNLSPICIWEKRKCRDEVSKKCVGVNLAPLIKLNDHFAGLMPPSFSPPLHSGQ